MGDPRRTRTKYARPSHPWQRERIEAERELLNAYGLKNKTEIWKTDSKLKTFTAQAKKLIAARGKQAEVEQGQLITRLAKYGLVPSGAKLDDVLSLNVKSFLERRLQTLLVRKGLANTFGQSRQFITHAHISVNGKLITSPSYLVAVDEEPSLAFTTKSVLATPDHPARTAPKPSASAAPAEAEKPQRPSRKPLKRARSRPAERPPAASARGKQEAAA